MVPQTVVYFTAYDQLKVQLGLTQGQHNLYAPMVAGMSARGELILSTIDHRFILHRKIIFMPWSSILLHSF